MALLTKIGYGQVEPNHLSAQRTGQIYAQLPMSDAVSLIQNGNFVKYDRATGECNFTGAGEWMLVYNEVKLYDKAKQGYKDFALKVADAVDGVITPRVFKTNVEDTFTTNLVDLGATAFAAVAAGDKLTLGGTGLLTLGDPTVDGEMVWMVEKKFTMPDGQAALKVVRLPDAVVADV